MNRDMNMREIAYISSGFTEKFGIPRQSGLVETKAEIIFLPEYRNEDALRGIEEYTHLWLIWGFSEVKQKEWKPTVRPPRLGGNVRKGVFATRSPFRPNPVGLSSVELVGIRKTEEYGIVLQVVGADLLDGTPIYDIKPYIPYTDCHPDAEGGFAEEKKSYRLEVKWETDFLKEEEKKQELTKILEQDPRPSYQNDPDRIYGMAYEGMEIKFRVEERTLYVISVE